MERSIADVDLKCQPGSPVRSSLGSANAFGGASRDLLHDMLRKPATAAEFDSRLGQLKQDVLSFLADGDYMLHIDKQAAGNRRWLVPSTMEIFNMSSL